MSATNRGAKRSPNDFYSTPAQATISLLRHINPWGAYVLEPCMGDGAIIEVLRDYTSNIDWCEVQMGRDFFTYQPAKRYDYVITNPPYSLAQQFIDHSLTMADTVIMLLRINFFGAQGRREWWQTHKPHELYVLSDRPKFTVNKHGKLSSDATEYAWYVWHTDKPYTGTMIHVI